jgi:hypothetical protein
MNAVPFDTLKMAHRLEAAGFSGPQAAGAAEALAEALAGTDLATKSDLNSVESRLRSDLASLETKLLGAIELAPRDMTIKLGGIVVVGVGILAALHYLPAHP